MIDSDGTTWTLVGLTNLDEDELSAHGLIVDLKSAAMDLTDDFWVALVALSPNASYEQIVAWDKFLEHLRDKGWARLDFGNGQEIESHRKEEDGEGL